MTIYRDLLALGYSDAFIRKVAIKKETRSCELGIFIQDTPDGEPLVGLYYQIDYRSEEEEGIRSLPLSLGISGRQWLMDPPKKNHIAKFRDIPSLIIAWTPLDQRLYTWGKDITSSGYSVARGSLDGEYRKINQCYDSYFSYGIRSSQGLPEDYALLYMSIPEMKELARKLGIIKLPRNKADIIKYIESSPAYTLKARRPDSWPAWFHYGKTLVLRADNGIVADVLNLVYASSHLGTTAMEQGKKEFIRGMLIYDGEDVGPLLEEKRNNIIEWITQAFADLYPVSKELKLKYPSYSILGDPEPIGEGIDEKGNIKAKYFINVRLTSRLMQVTGYHTKEELKAEKFLEDLIDKYPNWAEEIKKELNLVL